MAHKMLSPSTYSCDLCKLTHGAFGQKQAWHQFLKDTSLEFAFLHRDEFEQQQPKQKEYPLIFKVENDNWSQWLGPADIAKLTSEQALIQLIRMMEVERA